MKVLMIVAAMAIPATSALGAATAAALPVLSDYEAAYQIFLIEQELEKSLDAMPAMSLIMSKYDAAYQAFLAERELEEMLGLSAEDSHIHQAEAMGCCVSPYNGLLCPTSRVFGICPEFFVDNCDCGEVYDECLKEVYGAFLEALYACGDQACANAAYADYESALCACASAHCP